CSPTAITERYTLSLHDALPIYLRMKAFGQLESLFTIGGFSNFKSFIQQMIGKHRQYSIFIIDDENSIFLIMHLDLLQFGLVQKKDRKSTRLNSSHVKISYAVFC